MDKLYKQIGQRIRAVRQKAGMTLEQLGTEVGLDWSHCGGIERGTSVPSVAALAKIAQVLRVPLNTLFPGGPEVTEKSARMRRLQTILAKRPLHDTEVVFQVAETILKYGGRKR